MQMAISRILLLNAVGAFLSLNVLAAPVAVDKISLQEPTSKADQLYGRPKYFDTRGFSAKQYATRCFYGEGRGLPAIEWDSKFRVTRVAGSTLQKNGLTIHRGAPRDKVGRVLGPPNHTNGTVETYNEPQSQLQVFYDSDGRVKMFNLLYR